MLQFVPVDQVELVVPFHVALAAINEEAPPNRNEDATKRNFAVHRKIGEAPEKRRGLGCKLLIISILFDPSPFSRLISILALIGGYEAAGDGTALLKQFAR